MRTSTSTEKLVEALVAARAQFAPVLRDAVGQVGQHEYRYANLSGILDAVMPALLANGLMVLQAVDAESATLITRVAHQSGEWIESSYPLKLDLAPQSFGSCLTYGRRYSLQSLLCLSAEDDDGASAQPTTRAAKKAAKGGSVTVPPVDGSPTTAVVNPKRRDDLKPVTDRTLRMLRAEADRYQWPKDELRTVICEQFGVTSSRELRSGDVDGVLQIIRRGPPSAKAPPMRESGADDVEAPF